MDHEISQPHEEQAPSNSPFAPPLPYSDVLTPPAWTVPAAFFNWGGSLVFALLVPLLLLLIYGGLFDPQMFQKLRSGQMTVPIIMLQLVGTFGGQVLSLLLSWVIVTGFGKRSFRGALGLGWTDTFKFPHAVALGVGLFGLSLALMALLPRHETDMDKLLQFGLLVRVTLALVATVGAPIQEEIVYRGVLYTALEKAIGLRASLVIVSLLFWSVHVFQYRESLATLVAVLVLSFALTALRAWSGKLLPCVATHLFFNAIQGVLIIFAPDKAATTEPMAQPALLWNWLGG
jgi:membrane protease YdiL (CAAX protease family)